MISRLEIVQYLCFRIYLFLKTSYAYFDKEASFFRKETKETNEI
jgi:hypothetical protein